MKKMFNKMSNTVKTMTCKAHCAMTCARAQTSRRRRWRSCKSPPKPPK